MNRTLSVLLSLLLLIGSAACGTQQTAAPFSEPVISETAESTATEKPPAPPELPTGTVAYSPADEGDFLLGINDPTWTMTIQDGELTASDSSDAYGLSRISLLSEDTESEVTSATLDLMLDMLCDAFSAEDAQTTFPERGDCTVNERYAARSTSGTFTVFEVPVSVRMTAWGVGTRVYVLMLLSDEAHREHAAAVYEGMLDSFVTATEFLAAGGTVPTASTAPGNDPEPEPTEPPEKTMELPVIEPVVLYEKADVKITALELSYDRWFGPQLKVRIENASEKDLTFSVHEGAVNGFMVDLSLYTSVAHRAETTEFITISESDLKLVGIETIDSIEFEVLAYASDNWETYFDTDVLMIETGGASEFTYDEAGEVLYDANGVRVIYQGLTEEEAFGTGLKLYAINSSDQTVTITLKDVSINGHEVDSYASCTLLPNRRAVTSYTFPSSAIKENGIETFETATITLHLYNAKTWLDIADSVPIELIF